MRTNRSPRWSPQAGVTLIEVLVALALLSVVFIVFLSMLDGSAQLAKSQGNISDITEGLRFGMSAVIRVSRMAGSGGLPVVSPDSSGSLQPLAFEVQDNVSSASAIGGRTPLDGTDVLVVRGVMTGDLWDVGGADVTSSGGTGQVLVRDTSPYTGQDQELSVPSYVVGMPVAISSQLPLDIGSSLGGVRRYSDFRIGIVSSVTEGPGSLTLSYRETGNEKILDLNRGGTFQALEPEFVVATGLIDDMTLFVADDGFGRPTLYRVLGTVGAAEELVPNISDLQIALGCDLNGDGVLAAAEWFQSSASSASPNGDQLALLREVRISLVARSEDPEPSWTGAVPVMENAAAATSGEERFRHRALTVQVGLRSHPPVEAS